MKARTSSRNAASSQDKLSSIAALPLPLLAERPNFVFEGPGVARLLIELPIGFRDRRRAHQAIGIEILDRLRALPANDELAHPFGIDTGVDHQMGDMDVLGTKLARGGLRDRPQSEFRAGESRKTRATTHARGGAREEDVALAAGKHQTGSLAAGKKAGITGHFPHFAENALGGL